MVYHVRAWRASHSVYVWPDGQNAIIDKEKTMDNVPCATVQDAIIAVTRFLQAGASRVLVIERP